MNNCIVTVEKVKSDSIQWKENGFDLSIEPFPVLKNAKVGDKFRLYWNGNSLGNYGIGVEIKKVKKA